MSSPIGGSSPPISSSSSNYPPNLASKPLDYQIAYQKIITKINDAATWLEPEEQISLTDKNLDRLTKKTLKCIKKQDDIPKEDEVPADRLNHWLDAATWLVVDRVGALMFDNHIGSGGQTDVYLGVTPDRSCAVKINKEETSPARESAFLETLAHSPHVIDRIAATDWYQIEPLYPEDLSDLCYKDPLQAALTATELRRLKKISHHLLQGIAHMHERGIVHGDLKPENILLDEFGDIKIGDLGAAFKRKEPPRGGTHVFFAPEQIHHYFRIMAGENGALLPYPTQIDVWQGMLVLAQLNKGNLSPDFRRRLDEYLDATYAFGHETKKPDGTVDMEGYVEKMNLLFEDIHRQRTENGLSVTGLFSDLKPTTFLENLLVQMSSFHPRDRISSSDALRYFEKYCQRELAIPVTALQAERAYN